jgi:hypothetical protein
MKPLILTLRAFAVLLGLFLAAASLLDVTGVMPHSDATPPLVSRIVHSVPFVIIGTLLAVPYRLVGTQRQRVAMTIGLSLVVAWALYLWADGLRGYLSGIKSWDVLPAGALLTALTIGNLWAFLRITRDAPSFTPSRPVTTA